MTRHRATATQIGMLTPTPRTKGQPPSEDRPPTSPASPGRTHPPRSRRPCQDRRQPRTRQASASWASWTTGSQDLDVVAPATEPCSRATPASATWRHSPETVSPRTPGHRRHVLTRTRAPNSVSALALRWPALPTQRDDLRAAPDEPAAPARDDRRQRRAKDLASESLGTTDTSTSSPRIRPRLPTNSTCCAATATTSRRGLRHHQEDDPRNG